MARQLSNKQIEEIVARVTTKALVDFEARRQAQRAAAMEAWLMRQERRHQEYQKMLAALRRGDTTKAAGWYVPDAQKVVRQR